MDCVNCGKEIAGEPTWANYADHPSRDGREPFPLHRECFEANERVTVTEAHMIDADPFGVPVYEDRERTFLRYRKVKAPAVTRG